MNEEEEREESPEEEPAVYAVRKDLNGWQFDRRTFLAAAGAAAAAATLGSAAACAPLEKAKDLYETVVIEVGVTATPSETPELPEEASTEVPGATETARGEATATKTTTPTKTPTSTKTPSPKPTSTSTPKPTPAAPKAQFVKDVTIPDGTVMKPSQAFTKTWRFKNVGAVPWGEGVKMVFVEGKIKGFDSRPMQGPGSVDVPSVAPGKTVDVSVDLLAPQNPGRYRSYWRLKLGNGEWLENVHYAEIHVASQEEIKPGEEGIQFKVKIGGEWVTWTQPCGSPIPPGAVCVCNCVTAPATCACVGHTTCTCDSVHYWYPC